MSHIFGSKVYFQLVIFINYNAHIPMQIGDANQKNYNQELISTRHYSKDAYYRINYVAN